MENDLFLKACNLEKTPRTPVWLMRQAGRYMEEYQEIREKYSFLEMCKNPKVAAKITIQPVDKLQVDAAILFSDILIPIEAMGIKIEFQETIGPVILNPVRNSREVESLKIPEPEEDIPFVEESIKLALKHLEERVPLIGFSGAPFTLASYMVEGEGSRNYENLKVMMWKDTNTYNKLMNKLSDTIVKYLNYQIDSGVHALQLFDSWVGCLSPTDYERYVLPFTKKVIKSLKNKVPIIYFATGASTLLELMRESGGDVIGIDWRINLDEAWKRIGYNVGIQGNLDPAILLTTKPLIKERVRDILYRAENRPGHIFNLGHGILPQTPVENVISMVKFVKKWSIR